MFLQTFFTGRRYCKPLHHLAKYPFFAQEYRVAQCIANAFSICGRIFARTLL